MLENNENYFSVRNLGGYIELTDKALYKVSGNDAAKYIQTQITNDVFEIDNGKGQDNALVNRKGYLESFFTIHRLNGDYYIYSEKELGQKLFDHLSKFHFTEDFEMVEILDHSFLFLQGQISLELTNELFSINFFNQNDIFKLEYNSQELIVISKSITGETGFLFFTKVKDSFIDQFKSKGLVEIEKSTLDILRVEAGIPKYKVDITEKNKLPETGLEKVSVSYSKGCYLGQEVIARIKTYGVIPNALIGMFFENEALPEYDSLIKFSGKKVGQIKSTAYSPILNKNIAIVYLNKEYRNPDEKYIFQINDQDYSVKIKLLPFYTALETSEIAKNLYERALDLFANNEEEKSIELLEKAILLKPDFEDAYESLGVIVSRLGRYEEAIKIMNKLVELNPQEPMARTNLSVFYMRLGDKEEAESQMAKATEIKIELAIKERKAKRQLVAEKKQQEQVIRDRMEMFKEVLETIDSDDLVANYGMGKSYYDLDEHQDAIPYFEKAILEKSDYSVAFEYLGKSYEAINNLDKALDVYKKGIIAASQKGDLMPLKQMEQRKYYLENKALKN